MPNNNITNPTDLFSLENQVIADLTNFNKKFETYSRCVVTGSSKGLLNENNKKIDLTGRPCVSNNTGILTSELAAAYDKLTKKTEPLGSIVLLQNAIDSMSANGGVTPQKYLQNYYTIMNTYRDVVKKRQSLDANLAELYEIGDTKTNFYQRQLMITSYTKILLTILASTLTVAVFLNMRRR